MNLYIIYISYTAYIPFSIKLNASLVNLSQQSFSCYPLRRGQHALQRQHLRESRAHPTDLFDQVQLNISRRFREDFAVLAPHHITSGCCPANQTGHQQPCVITATLDSSERGRKHLTAAPRTAGSLERAADTHRSSVASHFRLGCS